MNKERRRQNYSSFTKRNGYKFGVPLETDKIGMTIAKSIKLQIEKVG